MEVVFLRFLMVTEVKKMFCASIDFVICLQRARRCVLCPVVYPFGLANMFILFFVRFSL
jgi:hypothetical protein